LSAVSYFTTELAQSARVWQWLLTMGSAALLRSSMGRAEAIADFELEVEPSSGCS